MSEPNNQKKNTIMKMKTSQLLAVALMGTLAFAATGAHAEDINTRFGKIEVESGYPSKEGIGKLTDEMNYQRACQAYI